MTTKERTKIVANNINYINTQVKQGDSATIEMGQLYNMNVRFAEPCSLALFDAAFDKWYAAHKVRLCAGGANE